MTVSPVPLHRDGGIHVAAADMNGLVETLRGEGGVALMIVPRGTGGEKAAEDLHAVAPSNDILFGGSAPTLTFDRFDDLLALALAMEPATAGPADVQARLRRLQRQGRMALVVLDGAEGLSRHVLLGLQAFVENVWPAAFGVVLVAGPEMRDRLDKPANDPLRYLFAAIVDRAGPRIAPNAEAMAKAGPDADPPRTRRELRAEFGPAASGGERGRVAPGEPRLALDASRRRAEPIAFREAPLPLRPLAPAAGRWRWRVVAAVAVPVIAAGIFAWRQGLLSTSNVTGLAATPVDPGFIEVAPGEK